VESPLKRILLMLILPAAGMTGAACDPPEYEAQSEVFVLPGSSEATITPPVFVEITQDVSLSFVHDAGHDGSYFVPETMGGGVCVFDYNNDGRPDIYLINGGERSTSRRGETGAIRKTINRLFRQEVDGTFIDVTMESGLGDTGYGMGCAVGDINNDGHLDVYVTNYGPDALFLNNGDGTFTNVTEQAGIRNHHWSASAAFIDYDRDGWLDLYVTNYLKYDPHKSCTDAAGRPDYCGPTAFPGVADVLYRNEGDGRFRDVSVEAGIASVRLAGLGVVCLDLDDDGWPDIYAANDADPNNLWINRRDGTFVDEAVLRGVAYNGEGHPEAGMGIALGDVTGNGWIDLFLTHLIDETNTYYRNLGGGEFEDATAQVGLGVVSLPYTGFGTAFFDYDHDGHLDVVVVNGAVKRRPSVLKRTGGFWDDFAEPNLFFANDGKGRFVNVSEMVGAFGAAIEVTRAFMPVDIDGDGDLDLLVTNIDGPARLYRNDTPGNRAWLMIRVIDPMLKRDALGAKVVIDTGERKHVRFAVPPGSYLVGAEPIIHLGLGAVERFEKINVRWPDGAWEVFPGGTARQRLALRKGEGRPK
jgi:hypothetical protein